MRIVVPFSVAEPCCPAAVEHDYAGDDNQGLEAAMEVLKSMPLPSGRHSCCRTYAGRCSSLALRHADFFGNGGTLRWGDADGSGCDRPYGGGDWLYARPR